MCMLSHFSDPQYFATLRTVGQAPLSMGFWRGFLCPLPGYLPDPGIKLMSPALAGGFFTTESPGKSLILFLGLLKSSFKAIPVLHLILNKYLLN